MNIKRVVLEHPAQSLLSVESSLIKMVADYKNIPIVYTSVKKLVRNQFDFLPGDLPVGNIDFMVQAARLCNVTLDTVDTYPACLEEFMGRKITRGLNLNQAKQLLELGNKFFIKPTKCKRFTGFVVEDATDPRFNGTSKQQEVLLSEVVTFVQEVRCYILNGKIIDLGRYSKTNDALLDLKVMLNAINVFSADGAPIAYGADFGLLDDGRTVLIEINDGWSLGAYPGVTSDNYWDILATRWNELNQI